MTLKQTFLNAFNIKLPISGGSGNSIDTPIILDKDGPSNYVETEQMILDYIGALRGITWKMVSQTVMKHKNRYIDQIKIKTVYNTKKEVKIQIESYYFDVDYFVRNS